MLNYLIKIALILAMAAVFYFQIIQKEDADQLWSLFKTQLQNSSPVPLILALILVPLNWGLESQKWLSLLRTFVNLKFSSAYKAVLAGVTVSLFTPNRIGEYAGRVIFLPDGNRWNGTMSTIVGSFAQLIALLSFGLVAVIGITIKHFETETWLLGAYFALSSLLIGLLLMIYFNIALMVKVVKKLPFWNKWKKQFAPLKALQRFPARQQRLALFYACLRYLVYLFQYFLLAKYFGIEIGIWDSFLVIGTIFLVQTSIPLPPIWSLLVRGQAALYFWGLYVDDPLKILASTFGLWVINLILPALLGLTLLIFTNIPKTMGYEHK